MTNKTAPLIVTITLEQATQSYFNVLRQKYFPAHCNYLDAHVSLFHRLPSNEPIIQETLHNLQNRKPINIDVTGIKNMATGVAFNLQSVELQQLHKQLQQTFKPYLTLKDKKKIWPHITIQNKVTAFKATQTAHLLSQDFKPFSFSGIGFSTWFFHKNKWLHQEDILFTEL